MITSVWEGLRAGHIDAVLGTSPPMFQLPSAWLVSRIRRVPFVLEIRDLWPDFAIELGVLRQPSLIACARWVEHFFYRHHEWAIVNSPGFVDHLRQAGVAPERLTVIPNGVDATMFDPLARGQSIRDKHGWNDDNFVVVYAGALGRANDIGTIVRAAARLRDEPRIRIALFGGGKELAALQQQVQSQQLDNVVFGGPVAKSQMREVLAAADLCLATLQDQPMFRTVYPNKVFDYLAAGRPVLVAIDGVIRKVIEQAGAGKFIAPGNDALLAAAIREYAADRSRCVREGQAGRAYVVEHFDRARQGELLEHVVLQAINTTARVPIYARYVKRGLDLLLASAGLLVVSPILLITWLLVRWRLGSPAIFAQPRAGRHGQVFTLYKFRTMREAYDAQGQPLPDDVRLTPLGQWLRKLSLDELPQLWNIVLGHMSLVGPRPLLVRYLPRYSNEQARRHEVRPGITGWAQVHGRNAIDWPTRFRLDVWYVDHCSWQIDLAILWKTLGSVVSRRGVTAYNHATMPEFMGNDPPCTTSAPGRATNEEIRT